MYVWEFPTRFQKYVQPPEVPGLSKASCNQCRFGCVLFWVTLHKNVWCPFGLFLKISQKGCLQKRHLSMVYGCHAESCLQLLASFLLSHFAAVSVGRRPSASGQIECHGPVACGMCI